MSYVAPFHRYAPTGPVLAAFLNSSVPVAAIMGPVGSGKTGACLMRCLYRAMGQAPHPDGIRRTRFAVIRKTYRDLERTLILSWHRWVPGQLPGSRWVGGTGGQPARHEVRFKLADGTVVETEILFLAIGENSAEEAMRGLEVTGIYLNEADTLDREVLIHALSRVGRYPAIDREAGFSGCAWSGVWLDFNAPDTEHWIYALFVETLGEGWAFFHQPGGLEAGAENLANLPEGYYRRLAEANPDWWVRRFIHNQFGYSRDGQPIYPEFSERLHLAGSVLRPTPGLGLEIGVDGGRTPAAVIRQRLPSGHIRCLAEVVTDGMGATRFGQHLRDFLAREFQGFKVVSAWGDPAAGYAARDDQEERSWLEIVTHGTGIPFRAAPTNDPVLRTEAVRRELTEILDGQPVFQISPACKTLVKGFLSGYRYRRMRTPSGERFDDVPEKNGFSHPHDANQYAAVGGGAHMEVRGRRNARLMGHRPIVVPHAFNPLSQGAR